MFTTAGSMVGSRLLRSSVGVGSSDPLPAFAWPGGYPMLYLDRGGEVLCPECATDTLDDEDEMFPAMTWLVYYEGAPQQCAACNKVVESAYGDPDVKEEA